MDSDKDKDKDIGGKLPQAAASCGEEKISVMSEECRDAAKQQGGGKYWGS